MNKLLTEFVWKHFCIGTCHQNKIKKYFDKHIYSCVTTWQRFLLCLVLGNSPEDLLT